MVTGTERQASHPRSQQLFHLHSHLETPLIIIMIIMKKKKLLYKYKAGEDVTITDSRKHRIPKVKEIWEGARGRGAEQPCKQKQQMWILRVWSMAVAVYSAHQPIALVWGAFITRRTVWLMKNGSHSLASTDPCRLQWLVMLPICHPLVKTSFSANRVTWSADLLPALTQ